MVVPTGGRSLCLLPTRRSSPSRWSVDEYSLLPTLLIDALVISFAQVGELDRALALHERSGIHERMFALRPVAEAANEEEGEWW